MQIKLRLTLLVLIILSIASILISLDMGAINISSYQLLTAITSHKHTLNHEIIYALRLPRTIAAFVTGGMLALAGALMQVLLRNPLADPYVLGVSGGAAVMCLVAMLLGVNSDWLSIFAFSGALMAMAGVFVLAKAQSIWSPTRLLLTGIIIASGLSACISFILTISPNIMLHSMLFWLMGDLSYAHFSILAIVVLVVGLGLSLLWSRDLNLLSLGSKRAKSLGVNSRQLTYKIYFLSALLTGVAVSIAGSIGFIGLIIPHILRLLIGSDHRILLPASVLLGGTLLTLADTIARTAFSPWQLPVGIMTALIGVPVFLILLFKTQ